MDSDDLPDDGPGSDSPETGPSEDAIGTFARKP